MNVDDLSFGGQLVFVALGVVASILIPVLLAAVPKAGHRRNLSSLWDHAKPYVALGVVSFLISLVVLAFFASQDKELKEWWQAFLAGYAFDSTLQKVREGLSSRGG